MRVCLSHLFFLTTSLSLVFNPADGFVAPTITVPARITLTKLHWVVSPDALLDEKLDWIAHHLRLKAYDPSNLIYGLESKDSSYGIKTFTVELPIEPSLGLDLTEVAHSTLKDDHRGLVLVSGIHSLEEPELNLIETGDVITAVIVDETFQESTLAVDFDETMDILERAKAIAKLNKQGTIKLVFNRLVKRETVKVVIEQDWRDIDEEHHQGDPPASTTLEGLAGDNLRLLLMHNHKQVYDDRTVRLDTHLADGTNCGGEGICGTCLVEILDGMDTLNHKSNIENESKCTSEYCKQRSVRVRLFSFDGILRD